MIDSKCLTTEWIELKSKELNYSDKNLIEKVIRAFTLLEMLASSGCPFHFKGGSCLMLLLNDVTHRLSIDVDIMCPPDVNVGDYLDRYAESGFIEYTLVERRQAGKDVPKSHSKFFYKVAFKSDIDKTSFILLDVLYEDCHYQKLQRIAIENDFIETVGEKVFVNVPSIGDILGDKLTAFAPDTTGIPYYKNGRLATLEIIKQLYDIGRLFDKIYDLTITAEAFKKIAPVELGYRSMDTGDLNPIFDDILNTSLIISMRGLIEKDKFTLLQEGIKSIGVFVYKQSYHIENAIVDASKAAYISTLIKIGITVVEHYNGNPLSVADLKLASVLPSKLNKLKMGNPEAFFYWAKTSEIIDG